MGAQARFALVFFLFSLFFSHVRRSGVSRIRPGLPSFFFLVFFQEEWREAHQVRFALVFSPFFPRQEEWRQPHQARHVRRSAGGRTRPGLPLFFHFFPRQEECWGPASGPICPLFSLFSTSGGVASAASGPARQEECWGPHQARFALVFSFFSTSGGVLGASIRPDLPSFFPFFHVRWRGRRRQPAGSSWGITCILLRGRMERLLEGASQACFFFKRLHHLAT